MPKKVGTDEECLTFEDLTVGQKFISKPLAGDNAGHGGYAGVHYIMMKIEPMPYAAKFPQPPANTVILHRGLLSHSPNGMLVIPVE